MPRMLAMLIDPFDTVESLLILVVPSPSVPLVVLRLDRTSDDLLRWTGLSGIEGYQVFDSIALEAVVPSVSGLRLFLLDVVSVSDFSAAAES